MFNVASECLPDRSGSTPAVVFYGICTSDVPVEIKVEPPLVFTNKEEALKKVKIYPGARFKAFFTEKEAYNFSTHGCETPVKHLAETIENSEKGLAFRAPKSQEIVKLRKAIEKGDDQYFLSTVWSNPRYLIASGDTPTVMHEGFRYTALHIAARHNQPFICKLLLDIIQDLKFMQLLYDDDTLPVQERRMEYLTDLYLNLPDKGLSETPLHFACKFGCVKVVEILLSYPTCDRNHINKYGDTARKIICDRCSTPNKIYRREIDNLFEDKYFVPVLRSDDNSLTPVLGRPCSPEKLSLPVVESITNPVNSPLRIHAVAGPMSPELASQFYKEWKGSSSPVSRSNCRSENMIRRTDSGKGLERVGRLLAKEHQVGWNEYWPFLDDWCNFSTLNGLMKLEKHFKNINKKMLDDKMQATVSLLNSECNHQMKAPESKTFVNSSSGTPQSQGTEFTPVTKLCLKLQDFHINSSTKDTKKGMDFTEVHHRHFSSRFLHMNENDEVRRVLHFDSPVAKRTTHQVELKNSRNHSESETDSIFSDSVNNNSPVHSDIEESSEKFCEMFHTPPSSLSSEESPLQTPEEIQLFFIMGSQPSKVDFDVYHALEDVAVEPFSYPLVFLWMESLSQYHYDRFSSSSTPQPGATMNSSFHSLPEYETLINDNFREAQQCWTFPVKRKHHCV